MTVFFKGELVVGTAYEQYPGDALLHQIMKIDVHKEFLAVLPHFIPIFALNRSFIRTFRFEGTVLFVNKETQKNFLRCWRIS